MPRFYVVELELVPPYHILRGPGLGRTPDQSRDVCCLSAPLRGTRFERSRVPERTVHSAQHIDIRLRLI